MIQDPTKPEPWAQDRFALLPPVAGPNARVMVVWAVAVLGSVSALVGGVLGSW